MDITMTDNMKDTIIEILRKYKLTSEDLEPVIADELNDELNRKYVITDKHNWDQEHPGIDY